MKVILNHFPYKEGFSNGVINYTKSVISHSDEEFILLSKHAGESQKDYQERVSYILKRDFDSDFVTIESAESQASSLLIPRTYKVHTRLHFPFYFYKKVIGEKPDENRFSLEVRALIKSAAVSSPSFSLQKLMGDEVGYNDIHVFKNPVDPSIKIAKTPLREREIDVVFLLRFNSLKGISFLNTLLRLFPKEYKVFLVGKKEERFELDYRVKCSVTILDHIEGEEKFDLLRNSKVSISLSKYENCSMVILESIGAGVPIVCWNVGGNAEIAHPPVVNVVEYGDVFHFSKVINKIIVGEIKVSNEDFLKAKEIINDDFFKGTYHIERYMRNETDEIYKGIDFSSYHNCKYLPYELRGESYCSLENRPLSFLLLYNNEKHKEHIKSLLEWKNIFIKSYFLDLSKGADGCDRAKDIIIKNKPDVVLLDHSLSGGKENEYISKSIRNFPVVYLSLLGNDILFDREGWLENSYFRRRSISYSPSDKKAKTLQGNILLVVGEDTKNLHLKLEAIRSKLGRDRRLDLDLYGACDFNPGGFYGFKNVFYIQKNKYSSVILLTSSITRFFLEWDVDIFSCVPDIFDNKNLINKFGVHDLNLNVEVFSNNDSLKKIAASLYDKKIINNDFELSNFMDECYAAVCMRGSKLNI